MKNKRRIGTFKYLQNERGSILLISYFVMTLMLGLGAAFLLSSTSESRTAERQRLATMAFHIAEAGIERGLYDLRQDFVTAVGTPSWADGNINTTYNIGPDTVNYYSIPYASTSLNGGSYAVSLKNVANGDVWLRSVGTLSGVNHTIDVYVKLVDLSPWNNAIFAGAGASGTMVNGNVDIRGSVHILGNGLNAGDYAIDMGGTAQLVGNNYTGLNASLLAKVPALPTVNFGGETVSTLNAVLRVKKGRVGVSGSATVGEANVTGNSTKETVDAVYVTDPWGGNQGTAGVFSDNGTTNAYDLGDAVAFPSLANPYQGYANYTEYFKNDNGGALIINGNVSLTPGTNVTYTSGSNTFSVDGAGNMTINGKVYINGTLSMAKSGSDTTITYGGSGTILSSGNVQIDVNLITNGNNSYPVKSGVKNIIGIMTPGQIGFDAAGIDVMGVFYGETKIKVEKQTDIMGTIVSNLFDMGTNVPSIFQVPATANNMPPGMIGSNSVWYLVVAWIKS